MTSLGKAVLALAKIDETLCEFPTQLDKHDPDYDILKMLNDDRKLILDAINYLMRP